MNLSINKLSYFLFVLSVLLYANTFNHGFVLDDGDLILNNKLVSNGVQSIPKLICTPYRLGTLKSDNDLYRPLSLIMFATEYQISGGNPLLSHILNVLLFGVCIVLLFIFLNDFFDRKKTTIAFTTALIFAVHPIHTEVVANIKSRDEILCLLFALTALICALKYCATNKKYFLLFSVLSYFLSLFSKETSICLLLIFPLVLFYYKNKDLKKGILLFFCIAGVGILYLTLRHIVLKEYDADHMMDVAFIDNMLVGAPQFSVKIATAIFILGKYLWLLFLPFNLICDYTFNSIPFTNFTNPLVLLIIVIYLIFCIASVYMLFTAKYKELAFGILWFLASIALFSNIIFPVGVPMAERFLFFPSVGFCLVLAFFFQKISILNLNQFVFTRINILFFLLILIFAGKTFLRNADWKNNLILFEIDSRNQPQNARLAYYYAAEITKNAAKESNENLKQIQIKTAIQKLHQAINIYPSFELAYVQLGNAYYHVNEMDSAEYYNLAALRFNKFNALTHYNIAGVYFYQKKYNQSKEHCLEAIHIKPEWADAYTSLALCNIQLNEVGDCIHNLHQSINLDPNYKKAYEILYMVYDNLGMEDSTKKYKEIFLNK